MLKIVNCGPNIDGITARLEGQICGPGIEVVRKYCEQAIAHGNPVALDVKDISFLDSDAVILFQQLINQGIRLINPSPFLRELLKQDAS